jgi:hypothetical protein
MYRSVAFLVTAVFWLGCSSSNGGTGVLPVGTAGTGVSTAGSGAHAGSTAIGTAGVGVTPIAGIGSTAGAAATGVIGSVAGSGGSSGADDSDSGVADAAGSGGAGGSVGAAGAGGGGGIVLAKPPCMKKSSEVVFIGDSYINYVVAHTLLSTLIEQRAMKDGALQAGQTYRNYAVPGTALAAPNLLGEIPPQFDQAVAADPDIKFVIMDGGGNDVLLDNMQCLAAGSDKNAQCQMVVANTLMAGTALMTKMRTANVSDVIYFFYPHVPDGGDDINDYALGMLQSSAKSLETPTFGTFVIDLIPVFDGHADWFASDNIHANDMGENAIADSIWKVMKDNCIAQPDSSGCCTP